MKNEKGNKMSKIIGLKVNEEDLSLIDKASFNEKRSRNSFLIYYGLKKAKEILEGVNKWGNLIWQKEHYK